MFKEYWKQIGIDKISRLSVLYNIAQAKQVQMLFDTAEDNHSAQHTPKFKVLEECMGLLSWTIDVTRFIYLELIGEKVP